MHLKTISERLRAILDLLGDVLAPTWPVLAPTGPSWERLGIIKASQASQKTLKFLRFF